MFLDILHFSSLFVKNLPKKPAVFWYRTEDLEREGKDTEDKETYRGLRKERIRVTKRMKIQRLILQIQREQETSKKRSETEL